MSVINFWVTLIASIITILTGLITIAQLLKRKSKSSETQSIKRNKFFGISGILIIAIALPVTAYSSLGRIFPGLYGPEWTDQTQYLVPKSPGKGRSITRNFSIEYPTGTKVIATECDFAWSGWNQPTKVSIDEKKHTVSCTATHRKHDVPRVVSMRVCYSRRGKGTCS